jgi:hypothetical protein
MTGHGTGETEFRKRPVSQLKHHVGRHGIAS